MAFFRDQKTKLTQAVLANEKVGFFREKIWPELEKFLIAGPVFVGFIVGVWRYRPGERHFEVAFQSLVFFSLYMAAMIVLQAADSLFLSGWPIVLGAGRSAFALLYLVLTLKQCLEWRAGEPKIYGVTAKLRNRVNLAGV